MLILFGVAAAISVVVDFSSHLADEESVETQSFDMCVFFFYLGLVYSLFRQIYQTQWPNDARWFSVNGTAQFIYFYNIVYVNDAHVFDFI